MGFGVLDIFGILVVNFGVKEGFGVGVILKGIKIGILGFEVVNMIVKGCSLK